MQNDLLQRVLMYGRGMRDMLRAVGRYCSPVTRAVDSWAPSLAFVAFWMIFSMLVKPAEPEAVAVGDIGHRQGFGFEPF